MTNQPSSQERIVLTGAAPLCAGILGRAALAAKIGTASREKILSTLFSSAPGFGKNFDVKPYLPAPQQYLDPCVKLALGAARMAIDEAGALELLRHENTRSGLLFATAFGAPQSLTLYEQKFRSVGPKLAPPLPFIHSYPNTGAALLALAYDLRGFHLCLSGGMTTGLSALESALQVLERGLAERLLVVAADAFPSPTFCDGAAALLLEKETAARARGATILATVRTSNPGEIPVHSAISPNHCGAAGPLIALMLDLELQRKGVIPRGTLMAHVSASPENPAITICFDDPCR